MDTSYYTIEKPTAVVLTNIRYIMKILEKIIENINGTIIKYL